MYEWLTNDGTTEIADYVPKEVSVKDMCIFVQPSQIPIPKAVQLGADLAKKFGFTAPLNWYKAFFGGLSVKDDAGL